MLKEGKDELLFIKVTKTSKVSTTSRMYGNSHVIDDYLLHNHLFIELPIYMITLDLYLRKI
jgi:hypothetical protein